MCTSALATWSIDRSVRDGDEALYEITLITCYGFYYQFKNTKVVFRVLLFCSVAVLLFSVDMTGAHNAYW